MMTQLLRIVTWNANGLCNHALELKNFLVDNDVDIILISETHFTLKSYMHEKAPGGTAVILKKNIKHSLREKFRQEYIQATSVEIWCWGAPLVLSAVYCPPKHNIKKEQFVSFFNTLGPKFVAAGDWNAKHPQWGSRLTSPRGRELFHAMQSKNYVHLSTGQPTYWPSDPQKRPDVIDFGVAGGINPTRCKLTSSLDLTSDHTPVILDLLTRAEVYERSCTLYNKYTDWNVFREDLDDRLMIPNSITSPSELDSAVET
uniref:Endonuclease/exonuclease/phosphatase domain-containing protein n=1 Tax=Phlebotomus papatasi TaxID=29031 RepID=A0A1B0D7Y4_PHLPP